MPFVFPEYEAAAVVFAHWEYMAPDHENVSSFSIVKIEIILFINRNMNMKMKIQGDFFNWPPLEFAKCWPVSNRFRKNVKSPRLAPPL